MVDADRFLRLRDRLHRVRTAVESCDDPVARRRVARRVEHIATIAPADLDSAEDALTRLERGLISQGWSV